MISNDLSTPTYEELSLRAGLGAADAILEVEEERCASAGQDARGLEDTAEHIAGGAHAETVFVLTGRPVLARLPGYIAH